jgi:hypothetical protein
MVARHCHFTLPASDVLLDPYIMYKVELSTGQKLQDVVERLHLVNEIEQDEADAIKAMAKQGLERTLKSFLKGMG